MKSLLLLGIVAAVSTVRVFGSEGQMQMVECNVVALHYTEAVRGEPVVFARGGELDLESRASLAVPADGYHVIF